MTSKSVPQDVIDDAIKAGLEFLSQPKDISTENTFMASLGFLLKFAQLRDARKGEAVRVKLPESVDEAALMQNLGYLYLQQYAPEKLTPPLTYKDGLEAAAKLCDSRLKPLHDMLNSTIGQRRGELLAEIGEIDSLAKAIRALIQEEK